MKLLGLYLNNFMCYDECYLDLDSITSAAVIIGQTNNNSDQSNAAGKSTIFSSIEYVLFNKTQVNLEKIIRDDTDLCIVGLDFEEDNKIYRIVRSRPAKGSADLSLYENINKNFAFPTSKTDWKDISSRRSSDTEKQLAEIIKITIKAFSQTVYFMQNDFAGLASKSSTERLKLFKESLNLSIYSKLEKFYKQKYQELNQSIIKNNSIIELLQDPSALLRENEKSLKISLKEKETISAKNEEFKEQFQTIFNKKQSLLNEINNKGSEFNSLNSLLKSFSDELNKSNSKLIDYKTRKTNLITEAKEKVAKLNLLKKQVEGKTEKELINLDSVNNEIIKISSEIKTLQNKIKEINVPLTEKAICDSCKQEVSDEYREKCKHNTESTISEIKEQILSSSSKQEDLNKNKVESQRRNSEITSANTLLSKTKLEITSLEETLLKEKRYSKELDAEIKSITDTITSYTAKIEETKTKISKVDVSEINKLKEKTIIINEELSQIENKFKESTKLLNNIDSEIISKNNLITECKKNIEIKKKAKDELDILNNKKSIFNLILEAFATSGIPSLIVHNIVDELEIDANETLALLRPGMQLKFITSKETDDDEEEALEIEYIINGKTREYGQLSGAQKLAAQFGLKLGLSLLLQRLLGSNLEFLLLDEIDQALDKASIDAFVDMVKVLSEKMKVILITHNDRTKDKFDNIILVEQDFNAVSKAKIIIK